MEKDIKIIAENRKARHDYHIDDTIEAGLVLTGTEVKSVRRGSVNLRDAYAAVHRGEAYVYGAHISPYEQGNRANHEPLRPRKLLLHRGEIDWLLGRSKEKGYTLVPLRLYFKRGKAKLEIGLGKGKKLHDKRRDIADREAKRAVERAFRGKADD